MKTRETKTPGIPDLRGDNTADVLRAMKSTLEVREGHTGDPLDRNVTYRHLADLKLVTTDTKTKVTIQGKAGQLSDLTAGEAVKVSYHKTGNGHHAVAIAQIAGTATKS